MGNTDQMEVSWYQQVEDSIERLRFSRVKEIELEGERFWMTVPSEAIAYELCRAAGTLGFDIQDDELWAGHICYDFGEDPDYRYIPYQKRRLKDYRLLYVHRIKEATWADTSELARHRHALQIIGEHKLFPNGTDLFGTPSPDDQKIRLGYRPMLVPLTRDGKWDKTFSQCVPDGELTRGGWLYVSYQEGRKTKELSFGDFTHDNKGYRKEEPKLPEWAIPLAVRIKSEKGFGPPLAWRSYRNVLICTRRFWGLNINIVDMWNMGLVPKATWVV